jgi:putative oxidoreductase
VRIGGQLRGNNREILGSWLLAALRVMAALVFLQHGLQKLIGFPIPPMPGYQHLSLAGLAGIMEVVATPFLVAGLFTRSISFVMSGLMAVAYFMGHAVKGFFPLANGGDVAVLLCFIFLHQSVAGPGAFALDTLLAQRRKAAARLPVSG